MVDLRCDRGDRVLVLCEHGLLLIDGLLQHLHVPAETRMGKEEKIVSFRSGPLELFQKAWSSFQGTQGTLQTQTP